MHEEIIKYKFCGEQTAAGGGGGQGEAALVFMPEIWKSASEHISEILKLADCFSCKAHFVDCA